MDPKIQDKVEKIIDEKWEKLKADAKDNGEPEPERPKQAGLCVSIYKPTPGMTAGVPAYDIIHLCGFAIAILQLGIAVIPCAIFGDWGILMITGSGICLSWVTAKLPQWKNEKWACRRMVRDGNKKVVLTRGNGSQHAIVILGDKGFLDLEDLAVGQSNVDVSTSHATRFAIAGLALLWILLLITAAGVKQNTWFLLAVGGIGILQNIFVAGWRRHPEAFGIPINYVEVFGKPKGMDTLFEVEEAYPYLGRSMRDTFFPGALFPAEKLRWDEYERTAKARETARRAAAQNPTILPGSCQNASTINGTTQNVTSQNAATQIAVPENGK